MNGGLPRTSRGGRLVQTRTEQRRNRWIIKWESGDLADAGHTSNETPTRLALLLENILLENVRGSTCNE